MVTEFPVFILSIVFYEWARNTFDVNCATKCMSFMCSFCIAFTVWVFS